MSVERGRKREREKKKEKDFGFTPALLHALLSLMQILYASLYIAHKRRSLRSLYAIPLMGVSHLNRNIIHFDDISSSTIILYDA